MIAWWWLLVVFFIAWWIGWFCRIADEYQFYVDHSADSDNVTSKEEK